MEVHNLGTAKPLPPLPRTKELHAIRFNGTRWTPKGAVRWCRMMGYKPRELETVRDGFQIVMTSANLFRDGTFKRVKVAKDIDGIIGNRLTEKR
jgi:hypothetical protein